MLSDYVPDDIHGSDVQYARDVYLQPHEDAVVDRGKLPQLDGHYYCIRDLLDNERNILAATTVTDETDWSTLPENHKYHRSPEGSNHDSDIRPLIRWYSRKRGILLHHYCLRDGEQIKGRAEDLLSTPPDELSHRDMQEAVSSWAHAPRVPHPDEDDAFDDSERALAERMSLEVDAAHNNWDRLANQLTTRHIADEQLVVGEIDDGHGYGGQVDRLSEIRNGPVQPAVYVLDVKLADEWHPRHLVQTEAYKRALADDMPGVSAAVARLGVTDGDYELITSHDDEWDEEELWAIFCRRAKSLYENGLYQAALRNAGR